MSVLSESRHPCPKCGATVWREHVCDMDVAKDSEVVGRLRCEQGHVVMEFLKPSDADLERGRQLAEKYGW